MIVLKFIKDLSDATYKDTAIVSVYRSFVTEINDKNIDRQRVDEFLNNLKEEKWSEFESKLGRCLDECRKDHENLDLVSDSYKTKLACALDIITNLLQIYREKYKQRTKKTDSVSDAAEQQNNKLKEINDKIILLEKNVEAANNSIDNKIFTLLINTVAILGIFVAIAFAGFGVTAIFPKVDINVALMCEEYLVKNLFYLLLVSLLCYNLLLLLVYLLFKLSRPLFISIRKDKEIDQNSLEILKEGQFIKTINLKSFLWIDGAIALLTVITFISTLVIW